MELKKLEWDKKTIDAKKIVLKINEIISFLEDMNTIHKVGCSRTSCKGCHPILGGYPHAL